jgi:hypothetical protein
MPNTFATDVAHASDFLRFLFGDKPNGYIATAKAKPGGTKLKEDEESSKSKMLCHAYAQPDGIDTDWWARNSTAYNIWFCTSTVNDQNGRHTVANAREIPAIWFDLDACKYLHVPGDAFFADAKSIEDVSAWVKSSENALQGYYKLDEPFVLDGSKEPFNNELKDLLIDIAMYWGADFQVASPCRLMRLPGTLNLKPEYPQPYETTAYTTKKIFTLEKLKKKFGKVNENTVPRVISFALSYIMQISEMWEEGTRHDIMYRLAGTVRKCGMNKEACINLFDILESTLSDSDDRKTDVESTYAIEGLDNIAGLRSGYSEIAEAVETVIEFWLKLKTDYCKRRNIKFTPENYDPTKPLSDNGMFFERGNETYYHGPDRDDIFANFCIRLRGKLTKSETHDTVWLAYIVTEGQPVQTIEITTAAHNTWATFSKIPHLPTGLVVYNSKIWAHYVGWLASICPDETYTETTYYGWLDVDNDTDPSLLLPNQNHPNYIWTQNNEDTAAPGGMTKELSNKEIEEYLSTFGDYIGTHHTDIYVWPTLGWFAAAPLSAFFRREIGGFPALVIYGLSGSGKSNFIRFVMGPHFGCKIPVSGYTTTTPFALRTHLTSNNICPMLIDEFKEETNDKTSKVTDFLGVIRSSWDGLEAGSGRADGTIRKSRFQAPLCVVGEHLYGEEATLHRTFSIVINHDWLNQWKHNKLTPEQQRTWASNAEWLYSPKHNGWLGTILLNWIVDNLDEALHIMKQCVTKVNEQCPAEVVERKRSGFAAPLAGLYILRRIYQEHDLAFPLATKNFLPLIFAADPQSKKTHYGSTAMTDLFKSTDTAIALNIRRKTPLLGSMYVLDPMDARFAYFDINRWRSEIKGFLPSTASASLTNDNAFLSLLKDANDKSPILGFPEDHPIFHHMCVKIDLKIAGQMFGINTHHWGTYETEL